MDVVNKHAHLKRKYISANHAEYMDKELKVRKTIKVRKTDFCVTLLRKKKADYFNNLDLNLVRDNKMFWKTISSYIVQKLAIEMCKVENGLCPKIMLDLFKEVTHSYNLRNSLICGSYKIKIVRYGTETITYLGPKIWSIIPDEKRICIIRNIPSKIKLWKPSSCPCRICKKYIANDDFVNLS